MERALQLNPNSANVLMRSGFLRTWVSDADGAIDHFTRSIRLTPLDPQLGYHYVGLSLAHMMKADFEKALDYARRAAREMPRWIGPWTSIAVAAIRTGQPQEAQAAVKQVLTLSPGYTIALRNANSFFRDKWVADIVEEGLRAAGMPER
jgi:adenylate cyclase